MDGGRRQVGRQHRRAGGVRVIPEGISQPPREWAERFFNVRLWTEMPRGGHFAAMEQPDLLAADIRAFFRPLRGLPRADDAVGDEGAASRR